nr:retrovirus-related Pol polyprotein from transposon TNT 1-94 [Tanacetum cinerariifolium]
MRIPLLYRDEYSQWSERFMNYLEEQTDGEEMRNSIKNGEHLLPVVAQVSLIGTVPNAPPTLKDPKFKTAEEKNTRKIDHLWDALERQMRGFKYGEQDRKALQVINDLKKCGYKKDNCELNYKFLNNLQPEWKQYGTSMRQIKNLMDINIDALYKIPMQNPSDVNDAMGYKKKAVMVTLDPLVLVAEKTKVSKHKKKVVVQSESEGSDDEDINDLKKITALLAKAFNRKKYYAKPTNNSLRTSSANKKPKYVNHSKLNKDVKRYSRKDLLSCINSHHVDTRSAYACNDAMNVSCNSRLYASCDVNDLFVFDDCPGTVRFGNNDFVMIAGYGDVVIGSMMIKKVYYVDGLGHNFFSVGQFCDKGLEQNGVVERRNRTLVKATRTMLTFANLPLFLWTEAITTSCFTQNRSIIHKRFDKTPYELINKRKPNIKFFHVFGCRCYLLNDYDDVGKLKAKGILECLLDIQKNLLHLEFTINTKDHPLHKIIGDPKSSVRTRGKLENSCLFSCLLSSTEPANVAGALKDADWVSAMKDELDQFARLKIWRLVPRLEGKTINKTKWIFKNKKDKSSLVIQNKARLVAVGYCQ